MENTRPNLVKFASLIQPKLPQNGIVNKDGSTNYVRDAKLIRLLSEKLRVQYEILTPSDGGYGTRQAEGNWSGMIGMIIRSDADIGMGGAFITEERFPAVNFTFPIRLSRNTFMTEKPQPVSKNLAIVQPFSFEVWIAICLLTAVASLLFYAFMNRKIPLQRLMIMIAGSTVEQSLNFKTTTNALRLLTVTWITGAMIFSYSYKAVLLSFLSFPTLVGIRDISDLSAASTDRSFQCFTVRGNSQIRYLMESEDASWKAIARCLIRNEVENEDVLEAFHAAAPKKAFVGSSTLMRSYVNEYFISKDSFSLGIQGIPFSRNFCCPDRLNVIIHRIAASGLLNKIDADNDFLYQLTKKSLDSVLPKTHLKIQLDDISGAFYILLFGWLLSFIVLPMEILTAKYCPKKTNVH